MQTPEDLHPSAENLERLRAVVERLHLLVAARLPAGGGAAAEHAREYGHAFGFGCCRTHDPS